MRILKIVALFIFASIIIIPIATFNFKENAVSEIDNRMLAANPFFSDVDGDFTENIQNFINDRIGLRDRMILGYTVLHDKLFGEMVHPSYEYGTEGYVFGAGITVNEKYCQFHESFADMVKEIQDYCTERGVPFVFVFNPSKPAVLTEYLPISVNYDRSWVDEFFMALEERQVRFIDNTKVLREKFEDGEMVFNQKYDANHWNDIGAYYGTNSILSELKKDLPMVHVNTCDDFTLDWKLENSLSVSQFPINEEVPSVTMNTPLDNNLTDAYKQELIMDSSYSTFAYYQNRDRMDESAPKALVFQGSYMNVYGYKYMANAFSEYIHVHDYQNILDFSYYYNIFQPDCVVFEVAEYTFSDTYFDYDKMKVFSLTPTIDSVLEKCYERKDDVLDSDDLYIETNATLTNIQWQTDQVFEYVWLRLGDGFDEFDMKQTDDGYEVTVSTQEYKSNTKDILEIVAFDGTFVNIYS